MPPAPCACRLATSCWPDHTVAWTTSLLRCWQALAASGVQSPCWHRQHLSPAASLLTSPSWAMLRQAGCGGCAAFVAFVGSMKGAHWVLLAAHHITSSGSKRFSPQGNPCRTALPGCSCALTPLVMLLQVYGVCRGPVNQAGTIKVLSPARRVDTLMNTDADFEGITGLWSVPAEPSGGSHVLVVLSFLAGSRALTAGAVCSPHDIVAVRQLWAWLPAHGPAE